MSSKPLLRWLHVSDLHFGHGSASHRFDQKAVAQAILEDAREMATKHGAPDALFITGDVAFSAKPEQYRDAGAFLGRLQDAVGVGPDQVFMVPGNHDVDRKVAGTGTSTRIAHKHLRGTPQDLDEYLAAPSDLESALWPKLKTYSDFSSPYGSGPLWPSAPFWVKRLADAPKPIIAVGLNTCLLSFDGGDAPSNLALGKGQLQRAISAQDKDALLLVLMHHPTAWLTDGGELESFLSQRPHLLFCGHVHTARGLFGTSLTGGGFAQLTAGAGHQDQNEKGAHAYAWGELSRAGIRFFPRAYVDEVKVFRAGPLKFKLDGDGCHFVKRTRALEPLEAWLEGGAEDEGGPRATGAVNAGAGASVHPPTPTPPQVDFASLPALDPIDRRIFRQAFAEHILPSELPDLLKDAGMSPGRVHLSGPAEAQWGAALDAAKAQGPAKLYAFLHEAVRAAPGALQTAPEGGVTFAERLAKYGVFA